MVQEQQISRAVPDLFVEQADMVDRRPPTILRQTDTVLDFYENPDIPLSKHIAEYLHDYTLPFIAQIRDGAQYYQRLSRKNNTHYLLTLRDGGSASRYAGIQEDQFYDAGEAYDVGLVTFRRMPFIYKLTNDKMAITGPETFRPPYTIEDYLKRTAELYMYVNDVISQDAPRSTRANTMPAKMRARGFFVVGASTPLHNTGTPLERESSLRVNPLQGYERQYGNLGWATKDQKIKMDKKEPEV